MGVDIHVCTSRSEFETLRPEWTALHSSCSSRTPFLTWEWLIAAWDACADSAALRVVCLRENGRLVAAAPLVERRSRYYGVPVSEVTFLGDGLSDRQCFLSADGRDDCLAELWRFLRSDPFDADLLRLEQLPSTSPTLASGRIEAPRLAVEISGMLPHVVFPADWTTFERSLTKKFRSEMRTRAKVFDALGSWELAHIQGALVTERLPEMASVEAASRKATKGYAFLSNPVNLRFLETFTSLARPPQIHCVLTALSINSRLVAYLFGFISDRRYHAYNIAYLPEFAKGSPGKYVIHHAMRFALESGATEFDFLRGDFFVKHEWSPSLRTNCRAVYFYPGVRNMILRNLVFAVRPALKRYLPATASSPTNARRQTNTEPAG